MGPVFVIGTGFGFAGLTFRKIMAPMDQHPQRFRPRCSSITKIEMKDCSDRHVSGRHSQPDPRSPHGHPSARLRRHPPCTRSAGCRSADLVLRSSPP